jgi:hypothetical protein
VFCAKHILLPTNTITLTAISAESAGEQSLEAGHHRHAFKGPSENTRPRFHEAGPRCSSRKMQSGEKYRWAIIELQNV